MTSSKTRTITTHIVRATVTFDKSWARVTMNQEDVQSLPPCLIEHIKEKTERKGSYEVFQWFGAEVSTIDDEVWSWVDIRYTTEAGFIESNGVDLPAQLQLTTVNDKLIPWIEGNRLVIDCRQPLKRIDELEQEVQDYKQKVSERQEAVAKARKEAKSPALIRYGALAYPSILAGAFLAAEFAFPPLALLAPVAFTYYGGQLWGSLEANKAEVEPLTARLSEDADNWDRKVRQRKAAAARAEHGWD